MARIDGKLVLRLLAAVLLAFAAWMLWPRPLAAQMDGRGGLDAVIITGGVEVIREDGAPTAQPTQELEAFTFAAGTPEAEAIRELLGRYSYHLCLDTLTGENNIEDVGSVTVQLNDYQGRYLSVHSGSGKLFLRGRVVRVGYLGRGRAAELCEALCAVLREA